MFRSAFRVVFSVVSRKSATAALVVVSALAVAAQAQPMPDDLVQNRGPLDRNEGVTSVRTSRLSESISVDGLRQEESWNQIPVISQFLQADPVEGAQPTERTEVRVGYDDRALYISAEMFDSAPDSIIARLGRRDAELESDGFVVFLDPFHDKRTGYYFGVNAAGTMYDGVLMNDDWDDDSWDGVWDVKTRRTASGWTAEFRIPYAQLRFYQQDEYVWGINFMRDIARKQERDYLVFKPREESGFVSRFVDLVGLSGVSPRRQVEFMPYVRSLAEFTDQPAGNPFNDGSRFTPGVGADLKVGLSSNLTLNATINPDFGQVEVDPAVVNLSDIETFFPEKRTFFVEGASVIQTFGRGGSNNNWNFNFGNPNFFYSRRIGRAPQGSLNSADYSDIRDGTRILGAAKLSGRIGSKWNVALVEATTAREYADLASGGIRSRLEVEPAASYTVARVQREFNDGRQGFGMLGTGTRRFFNDSRLRDELNGSAIGIGVDGWHFLDTDRDWVVTGWAGYTRVGGSASRIESLQRSPLHYFQRPDLDAVSVDATATTMDGFAGRVMLNKQTGRVTTNSAIGVISPGFDVNDLGFMWQTNMVNAHSVLTFRWTDPGTWYRRAQLNAAVFGTLDFDGNPTWMGVWSGGFTQFLNYHSAFAMVALNPWTVNNRRTRGGPLTMNPPGVEFSVEYGSDSRRKWVLGLGFNSYQQANERNYNLGPQVSWTPAGNVSVEFNPSINLNTEFAQYVGAYGDESATQTYGRRYVFAELDQVSVSSTIRLNWTFTPTMSLQLFAQPLISAGEYTNHKELSRSRSYDFLTYGEGVSTIDATTLTADPDGGGPAPSIDLPDLDFSFRSIRGTAVLRWEFRPGSLLYLVWTQNRADQISDGRFRFSDGLRAIKDAPGDNLFMVKLSYWLSR